MTCSPVLGSWLEDRSLMDLTVRSICLYFWNQMQKDEVTLFTRLRAAFRIAAADIRSFLRMTDLR